MSQQSGAVAASGPDWILCPGCHTVMYAKRLRRNQLICPDCGYHNRVPAAQRLAQLLDPGYTLLPAPPAQVEDPLGFFDSKPYPARLAQARRATGLDEAVLCARGAIEGRAVVVAVMEFAFLGGSLGCGAGERITQAAEEALAQRLPLLLVCASGGARMQEGALSLMQMAKTSAALAALDEAGILTISLITDPTFGGVAASFATLCDVIVAEPRARMGFAGRRVIEQTIRQSLPPTFQTAEFLLDRGMIDAVWSRAMLREPLSLLLSFAGGTATGTVTGTAIGTGTGTATVTGPVGPDPVLRDPALLPEVDRWQVVRRARHIGRPTTVDYISLLFEDFEELHGDRATGDSAAIVGGVGVLDGRRLVVIGHQKGHGPAELAMRDFGMASPAGYRKAARLMRLAGKLGVPVLTFVDTPGAYPGLEAEERGQAVAIAENLRLMASLPVPIVTVITGEGGSGGALGLAVADEVLICQHAVYSVITPEGCAAILWNDPAAAPTAATQLRLDPRELLAHRIVDGVIPEPPDGAQTDHATMARTLHAALSAAFARLDPLGPAELVATRRARFRAYGRAQLSDVDELAVHGMER